MSNTKHLYWNHFYWRRHLKAPNIPKDYHDEHDINSSYDNPKGFSFGIFPNTLGLSYEGMWKIAESHDYLTKVCVWSDPGK